MYLYFKALHVVFVVCWFAGLFYMPRLLIYSTEAMLQQDGNVRETMVRQFLIMQRRLWYGITWPSMVLTLFFGFGMIHVWLHPFPTWLIVKLSFVSGLLVYHFITHRVFQQQQAMIFKYTSRQLRLWNEVATVFLFVIVFVVVLKDAFGWKQLIALLAILFGLLGFGFWMAGRRRK